MTKESDIWRPDEFLFLPAHQAHLALTGKPFVAPVRLVMPKALAGFEAAKALVEAGFFARLEELHLTRWSTPDIAALVPECRSLRRLVLGTLDQPIDCPPAHSVRSLSAAGGNQALVASLRCFPDLEEVELADVEAATLDAIRQVAPSTGLVLHAGLNLDHLPRWADVLTRLTLTAAQTPDLWAQILTRPWPSLKTLRVAGSGDLDLGTLRAPELRELDIRGSERVGLPPAPGLTSALLGRNHELLEGSIRESWPGLTNLSVTRLDAEQLAVHDIGGLGALTALEIVDGEVDAAVLPELGQLRSLGLRGCHVQERLRLPSGIEELDVGHIRFRGGWPLANEAPLDKLRTLNLSGGTWRDLPALGSVTPGLKQLSVADHRGVSMDSLEGLQGTLEWLDLSPREDFDAPESVGSWIAGRRWPQLRKLRCVPGLLFDDLEGWLRRRDAPHLNELECRVRDPESVYRHLTAAEGQIIWRLSTRGLDFQRLRTLQPPRWPGVRAV